MPPSSLGNTLTTRPVKAELNDKSISQQILTETPTTASSRSDQSSHETEYQVASSLAMIPHDWPAEDVSCILEEVEPPARCSFLCPCFGPLRYTTNKSTSNLLFVGRADDRSSNKHHRVYRHIIPPEGTRGRLASPSYTKKESSTCLSTVSVVETSTPLVIPPSTSSCESPRSVGSESRKWSCISDNPHSIKFDIPHGGISVDRKEDQSEHTEITVDHDLRKSSSDVSDNITKENSLGDVSDRFLSDGEGSSSHLPQLYHEEGGALSGVEEVSKEDAHSHSNILTEAENKMSAEEQKVKEEVDTVDGNRPGHFHHKNSFELPSAFVLSEKKAELQNCCERALKFLSVEKVMEAHDNLLQMLILLEQVLEGLGLDAFAFIRPLQDYKNKKEKLSKEGDQLRQFKQIWDTTGPLEAQSLVAGESLSPIYSPSQQSLGEDPADVLKEASKDFSRTTKDFKEDKTNNIGNTISRKHSSKWLHRPHIRTSRSRTTRRSTARGSSVLGLSGLNVFCEAIKLCPAGSLSVYSVRNSVSQELSFQSFVKTKKNRRGSLRHKRENSTAQFGIFEAADVLGQRERLQRLAWPLGDLPVIIYAGGDPTEIFGPDASHQTVGLDPKGKKDRKTQLGPTPSESIPTSGVNAKLELPVGIHIHFRFRDPNIQSSLAALFWKGEEVNISEEDRIAQSWDEWQWLHEFCESFANSPHFHKLRYEFVLAEASFSILRGNMNFVKSWGHVETVKYKGWWKMSEEGKVGAWIDGVIEAPLPNLLCLIYESDLHKTWIPFLAESGRYRGVSLYSQIVRHYSSLPWPLDDRETMIFGYAVDCLSYDEAPCIMMTGCSIPSGATSTWGLRMAPPGSGVTRWDLTQFILNLIPEKGDRNKVRMQLILNLNAKMSFVPKTIQNFIAKKACNILFSTIQKMCNNMAGSKHEALQKDNPQFYEFLKKRLDDFYNS